MSFITIDNPGQNHCGFYAFAVGLLYLIIENPEDTISPRWRALDSSIQSDLEDFKQKYREILSTVLTEEQQQALLREFSPSPRFSNFFQPNPANPANPAGAISQVQPEHRFAKLCKQDEYAILEPFKNSIKTILQSYRLKQLDMLNQNPAIWLSDIYKSRLYVDFAELVEMNYEYLPHNICASSSALKGLASKIRQAVADEMDLNFRTFKLNTLIRQAFRDCNAEFSACITRNYDPSNSWWATEQDLRDLAEYFNQSVNIIDNNKDRPITAQFPCLYLQNFSNTHWKTRVYFSDSRPEAFVELSASKDRLVQEVMQARVLYNPYKQQLQEFEQSFTQTDLTDHRQLLTASQRLRAVLGDMTGHDEPNQDEDILVLVEQFQFKQTQLQEHISIISQYEALTQQLLEQTAAEIPNQVVIKNLNIRRNVLTEYLEFSKSPYQGKSKPYQEYCTSYLIHKLNLVRQALSIEDSNIRVLQVAIDDNETKIRQLKLQLYQKLNGELSIAPDLPQPRPGLAYVPNKPLFARKQPNEFNFLYPTAFGIGLGAIVLNTIPGVLSAVTLASGLTAVGANVAFILIAVYLVNLLSLIHQIYQEAQIHKYAPSLSGHPI